MSIEGKKVAILAADGFEESELLEPKRMLEEAGAETTIVSLKEGEIRGWKEKNWGSAIPVELTVAHTHADEFDALLLPGGVMNPDILRMDEAAVDFVRTFAQSGKPIGAICHAIWMLIEADVVDGRTVTSWPSLKTDALNAGAEWVDEEVVTDNGMVTSRKPADIPAFGKKLIEEVREGVHARASVR